VNGCVSERCRNCGMWHIRFLTLPSRYVLDDNGARRAFDSKKHAESVRRRISRDLGAVTKQDVFAMRNRKGNKYR